MTVKEMIKVLRRLPVDAELLFVTSNSKNESIVSEISNIVVPANHFNNAFYLYSEDYAEEYFKNIKEQGMEEDILKILQKKIKGEAGFVGFQDDDSAKFYIDLDCLNHGKIYIKVDPYVYTCGHSANFIAQGILEEAKQFVNDLLFETEGE